MSQICTWSFCTISSEDNDLHIDPQHPACDDWYDGMFSLSMWYLFYSNMHLTVNIIYIYIELSLCGTFGCCISYVFCICFIHNIYIYWTVTMWNFWMLHMICFCICFIHNIYMQISASYKIWVQILMHRIEMIPNDKWLHNATTTYTILGKLICYALWINNPFFIPTINQQFVYVIVV